VDINANYHYKGFDFLLGLGVTSAPENKLTFHALDVQVDYLFNIPKFPLAVKFRYLLNPHRISQIREHNWCLTAAYCHPHVEVELGYNSKYNYSVYDQNGRAEFENFLYRVQAYAWKKSSPHNITLGAKNSLGECEKKITLEIADQNVLVTPLLGYTSWNAFAQHVTQENIEGIADKMVELGITEYGYSYVNTDSGWQGEYGGKYDAIMPNPKFHDMKKMTDKIHACGLKCGIYSTPMLTAWGCPDELASIPGCTQGEPDYRFSLLNGGIGTIRKEKNNALQWCDWGFDYLKYDWAPTDTVNADIMREELVKLERDFGFCVTVRAIKEYSNYWSKYCNSYRCNPDTYGNW
jgi:hypothetical protein